VCSRFWPQGQSRHPLRPMTPWGIEALGPHWAARSLGVGQCGGRSETKLSIFAVQKAPSAPMAAALNAGGRPSCCTASSVAAVRRSACIAASIGTSGIEFHNARLSLKPMHAVNSASPERHLKAIACAALLTAGTNSSARLILVLRADTVVGGQEPFEGLAFLLGDPMSILSHTHGVVVPVLYEFDRTVLENGALA